LAIMSFGTAFDDGRVTSLGALAISAQASLAYFIAGSAKIVSPKWRAGSVLAAIMNTESYGHRGAAELLRNRPLLAKLICSVVIYGEIAFPATFLLPSSVAVILVLSLFAGFHLINAYFMGLGSFVVPFVGTYPAIFYVSKLTRDLLYA